jgi:hydroxymethylbilane synthase
VTIRVATRGSALARTQSQLVADRLAELTGQEAELVEVATHGDVDRSTPLVQMGGVGVFVAAVREAVLAGQADVAVHSLKDLPTTPADGLTLAAVAKRADARDALIARDGLELSGLPIGSRIGTGSPRRAAQLREVRPDLDVVDVRGNVDTRIRLVESGVVDGVILALAGLERLGRADEVTEILEPDLMLPAPGQGALAIECRSVNEDERLRMALTDVDHAATRLAVTAERELLAALEAGCSAPVGAYATVSQMDGSSVIRLTGFLGAHPGLHNIRKSVTGSGADPRLLGRELAHELLAERDPGTSRPVKGGAA